MSFEKNEVTEDSLDKEEVVEIPTELKEDSEALLPELDSESDKIVAEENIPEVSAEESEKDVADIPSEVLDEERLKQIRETLSGGVNVNEEKSKEISEANLSESELAFVPPPEKTSSVVRVLRRWMGIAGVATIGLGSISESQAQLAPKPEVKKEGFFGGLLRKAQEVNDKMAVESRMYGNYWSPGPGNHTEFRKVNGYGAEYASIVEVDKAGNVVRVLQNRIKIKEVPARIRVGISGGHSQDRLVPGQIRRVPTSQYQRQMMKQKGVNIGVMVQSNTGRTKMQIKKVK